MMLECTLIVALSFMSGADAGVDAHPDAGPDIVAPPEGEALFRPDHVLQVHLEMDKADWDTLRHQARRVEDLLGPGCEEGVGPSPYT